MDWLYIVVADCSLLVLVAVCARLLLGFSCFGFWCIRWVVVWITWWLLLWSWFGFLVVLATFFVFGFDCF